MTARWESGSRVSVLRRVGIVLGVVGLSANALGGVLLIASTTANGAGSRSVTASDDDWGATTDSAVTQQWADPALLGERDPAKASYNALAGITVTVSQTKDLTTQGITVSWSGAAPTPVSRFSESFFQVMQCWGDEDAGPSPEQCMWGTPSTGIAAMLGDRVGGRTLRLNEDPAQQYSDEYLVPPPASNPYLRAYSVPFETVDGDRVTDVSPYYTSATTNEVSAARTSADGSGVIVFNTLNAMDAPHLGCGAVTGGKPRGCWLVVVPRADTTAGGTNVDDLDDGMLNGSPLTATNWADRMVFDLSFQAVGTNCPLGNAERRLVGHELFSEAMTSWQSNLCGSGTTYGWSQIGDEEARTQLLSPIDGAARLAVISDPVSKEKATGNVLRYAPIARSAIVFGYNIERDLKQSATHRELGGTPVSDLTLNARLIAKLLTQSYRADVPGGGTTAPITSNPYSIVTDPEFVELNPEFSDFMAATAPEGLLVSLGSSDANAQVWQWLQSDPYARAFLSGEDDGHGMKINPAYLTLDLANTPTDSFPKADLTTYRASSIVPEPGFGTLDLRPYMTDMLDAAQRAQRGESGSKIVWDQFRQPSSFVASGAQLPGHRFQLALTDRTSAHRFGLRTASLVNEAGQKVAASESAVTKGLDSFVAAAADETVRVYDPTQRTLGAYPLATMSYAAVNVCRASTAELKDYSRFLTYAAGAGQARGAAKGQLPLGYLPLTAADKNSLTTLSALLTDSAGIKKLCPVTAEKPKDDKNVKKDDTKKDEREKPAPPTAPAPSASTPTPAVETPVAEPSEDTAPPPAEPAPVAVETAAAEPVLTAAVSTRGWRTGAIGAMSLGLPCSILGPLLVRRARGLPS
ncbi:hypothetical protein GCM10010401_16790 [Rarobacter faecitabidus]|uniref:Uncharacterized protein n=1 Tax=Rarobacter faecitabidus TaxID=13243 RepID=A0A542ZX92_RARFA|nr:hypothetical protein [Rarobacter faecitabidus]TQL64919.1 hypothetical protein FB461_1451 [Rarobacter faecitabidus]